MSRPRKKKNNHCRVAVVHNFKSEIYVHGVPGNTKGKMSQQVYIDQILDPIVKPWIQAHQDFVLSAAGAGPTKTIKQKKKNHDKIQHQTPSSSVNMKNSRSA